MRSPPQRIRQQHAPQSMQDVLFNNKKVSEIPLARAVVFENHGVAALFVARLV